MRGKTTPRELKSSQSGFMRTETVKLFLHLRKIFKKHFNWYTFPILILNLQPWPYLRHWSNARLIEDMIWYNTDYKDKWTTISYLSTPNCKHSTLETWSFDHFFFSCIKIFHWSNRHQINLNLGQQRCSRKFGKMMHSDYLTWNNISWKSRRC